MGTGKSPGAGVECSTSGRPVLAPQEGKATASRGGGSAFSACLAKSWLRLSHVPAVCPSACVSNNAHAGLRLGRTGFVALDAVVGALVLADTCPVCPASTIMGLILGRWIDFSK